MLCACRSIIVNLIPHNPPLERVMQTNGPHSIKESQPVASALAERPGQKAARDSMAAYCKRCRRCGAAWQPLRTSRLLISERVSQLRRLTYQTCTLAKHTKAFMKGSTFENLPVAAQAIPSACSSADEHSTRPY